MKRRDFLKVISAAGGAAVAQGCSPAPSETLIPYLVAPDDIVAGEAAFVATTCRECPAGCGVLAKTVDARVIKVEGNPEHPVNRGTLCVRGQASVQSLYDPDRFRGPLLRRGDGSYQSMSWDDAEAALAAKLREARARGTGRVAWIGQLATGSFERLTREWLALVESDRRLFCETFDHEPLRRAAAMVMGRAEIPTYRFDEANFVLSFGADFLETWMSNVEFTRQYAALRRRRATDPFGCFVFASPRLSLTGLNADGWVAVRAVAEAALALSLVHAIVADGLSHESVRPHLDWVRSLVAPYAPEALTAITDVQPADVHALARQFTTAGPSLAVGGGAATRDPHAIDLEVAVLLLNAVGGNLGRTVTFGGGSALDGLATRDEILDLERALAHGNIDVLLVHHANPAYALPGGAFESALARVPFVVSLASTPDETTAQAHLILPDHHSLESWGDYAPRAGVAGMLQPAMAPILSTRASGDVLLNVARRLDAERAMALGPGDYASYVSRFWGGLSPSDQAWTDALKRGGHYSNAAPVAAAMRDVTASFPAVPLADSRPAGSLTLIAFPSPFLYDGRQANDAWLQEIPDPVSRTVWNGWIEIHPDTARRLGLAQDDVVGVQSASGSVTTVVRLYEGVRPDVVAMPLGYGRRAALRNAQARGARAAALLPPDGSSWRVDGVSLVRQGRRRLIVLQAETEMPPGRPPMAQVIRPSASAVARERHLPADLYPPHAHREHRWGMAIDLNACTGCSACVAACYAENNVPVAGERACAEGREMSWIRIERYDAPRVPASGVRRFESVFLPMLCQQCDEAPCEPVCPVYATYHNPEGLNAQVYVRCIGTRFCSNNCPYKVRRFNFSRPSWPSPLELSLNPDVTVRSAGVMEKCTFCVQRIQAGKNVAAREQRPFRDGDVTPACAQTCPAQAIVFGDLNDPASRVTRLSQDRRSYHVLEELNTRPAIAYLKRVVPE